MEYRINNSAWQPVPDDFLDGSQKWIAEHVVWLTYNEGGIWMEFSGNRIATKQILYVDLKKCDLGVRLAVNFSIFPKVTATRVGVIDESTA